MTISEFKEDRVKALLQGHSVESIQDSIRKYIFIEFSMIATFDRMISMCMEVYHAIISDFEKLKNEE